MSMPVSMIPTLMPLAAVARALRSARSGRIDCGHEVRGDGALPPWFRRGHGLDRVKGFHARQPGELDAICRARFDGKAVEQHVERTPFRELRARCGRSSPERSFFVAHGRKARAVSDGLTRPVRRTRDRRFPRRSRTPTPAHARYRCSTTTPAHSWRASG